MDAKELLNIIRDKLESKFGGMISNIILFGSRADGSAHEHSDYDILIVLTSTYDWKLEREIYDVCYEIDIEKDILIDAKIISVAEIDEPRGKQPFILNALESGMHE